MQAIITIFELSPLAWKESLRISVSLDALKGTWSALSSIALMHSLSASKLNYHINYLLLIYAPSILLCRLLLCVSWARSDPARSTSTNFPKSLSPFLIRIWQIACEREEVSFATVACVVRAEFAALIIDRSYFASIADFYVRPWIWIVFDLSYKISRATLLLSRSRHLVP